MLSAARRQTQQEQGERNRFWDQRGTGSRAFAIRRLKRAGHWSWGGGLGVGGVGTHESGSPGQNGFGDCLWGIKKRVGTKSTRGE